MANGEDTPDRDRFRNYKRGQPVTTSQLEASLALCHRRNRNGMELIFALLATAKERPQAWETQHILALKDALLAVYVALSGNLPDTNNDDGGELNRAYYE